MFKPNPHFDPCGYLDSSRSHKREMGNLCELMEEMPLPTEGDEPTTDYETPTGEPTSGYDLPTTGEPTTTEELPTTTDPTTGRETSSNGEYDTLEEMEDLTDELEEIEERESDSASNESSTINTVDLSAPSES